MASRGSFHELSEEALFRYQVVSAVHVCLAAGHKRAAAVAEVLEAGLVDLLGRGRPVSRRTVYRWLEAYERDGLLGLEPVVRSPIADSKSLPGPLLEFVRLEKRLDPLASVPELIARARLKGVLAAHEKVSRTSLWRALGRMGLPATRVKQLAGTDMRRFAHPQRMRLVLIDGKHFKVGAGRLKRVAFVYLDDATRFGLELVVGYAESAQLFLKGLYLTLCRYGLMKALYADHGSGFTAHDSVAATARLGIPFIHGRKRYPEGRGKVEAFNRSLKNKELRRLDGNAAVDPAPAALTLRLRHWLHSVYNHSPHEGLGGDTPARRFEADEHPLEFPRDRKTLEAAFVVTFTRTVSKDNVISYGDTDYEVPRGHAAGRIRVFRHLLEGNALSVIHQGRLVRIHPVDLADNARSRRATPPPMAPKPSQPPTTAAQLAFEADLPPLVGPDGGYRPKGDQDDNDKDPK